MKQKATPPKSRIAPADDTEADDAALPSIAAIVDKQPRFVLTIHKTDRKGEDDPVYVCNGDYSVTVKRGVPVVVPQAVVAALEDTITGVVDSESMAVSDARTYPFTAVPYSGKEPIGTAMPVESQVGYRFTGAR